ncbi:MAG: phosphoribosylaminoimidazolesuccinocarboxamide synthase [Euzebyales bacterium]|jgi:phosphoribosylaminoimidazole-succinocarboxamide synthase|nr:phosphoribosylaminoimidazolesuccinocarboxamide synthase [Euzebyales bacterium]
MSDLTALPGAQRIGTGKVRELYAVGDDRLLLVASDRVSAFDVVLPTPIPDKGKVLTGLTAFWLSELLAGVVGNHMVTTDVAAFPDALVPAAEDLRGRAMLCRRAEMLPIECVARGYLAGSGWKEYRERGTVCGIPLPDGLDESARLPEPIFTPSTKATDGHDVNISFEAATEVVGAAVATRLRDLTLELYATASDYTAERGVLLADTKFEFGIIGDQIALCDEVLTPDSSRFWPADDYAPGRGQVSFDKQIVRDWLESTGWDKTPPGPQLPADVIDRTRARYVEVYERLVGRPFHEWVAA